MIWKFIGIVVLWCVMALAVVAILFFLSLPYPNSHSVAIYNHMIVHFATDRVRAIVVHEAPGSSQRQASLYMRIPNGRVVRAIEMTHADADQLQLEHQFGKNSNGATYDNYSLGFALIIFHGDHPDFAKFVEGIPIDLAPTPNGPWFRLPISKRQMYELFGKPLRWDRSRSIG